MAVELLPQLESLRAPISMVVGFGLGVAAMFATKALFANLGIIVPVTIDLFIDRRLDCRWLRCRCYRGDDFAGWPDAGNPVARVVVGSRAHALRNERFPGGFLDGRNRCRCSVLFCSAVGYAVVGLSGGFLAGILGFGVASLLYLVTEELLVEAHEEPDTPLIAATFFVGFLLPLVMAAFE